MLERRVHRFVRHLGYTARRNIEVLTEQNVTLAELDLMGVRFDETLRPNFIIIETSGGEKNFEDLLKLKSLSSFLPRSSIYYIGGNVSTDVVRFAEKVDIRAMHTSRLDEIEAELRVPEAYAGSCSEAFGDVAGGLTEILYDKRYGAIVKAKDTLWLESDPFLKLKRSRSLVRKLALDLAKLEDQPLRPAVEFLASEVTLLHAIALLESAAEMFVLPSHQREVIFKERLISGRISIREKEALMDRFYQFLVGYTRQLQRPLKIRREDLKLADPDAAYLFDITERVLKRSRSARTVPGILDNLVAGTLVGDTKTLEITVGPGEEPDMDYAIKLARDIVLPLFGSTQTAFVNRLSAIRASEILTTSALKTTV